MPLKSSFPPPPPQHPGEGCWHLFPELTVFGCLSEREGQERGVPSQPWWVLPGSPPGAAAFSGQHSRTGHSRHPEGWDCIPGQWDLPASPVLGPGSLRLIFPEASPPSPSKEHPPARDASDQVGLQRCWTTGTRCLPEHLPAMLATSTSPV